MGHSFSDKADQAEAAQPVRRFGNGTVSTVVVGEIGGHGRVRSRQVDTYDLRTHFGKRGRQRPAQPVRNSGDQHEASWRRRRQPFTLSHKTHSQQQTMPPMGPRPAIVKSSASRSSAINSSIATNSGCVFFSRLRTYALFS